MAVAVKPSKSLLNIRSGIKSIKNSFSGLRKNSENLNEVMLKKTKVKRESIARNYILSQRRQEQERRKNKEDLLEASSIGGAVKRQAKVIASSAKGFLGRIMDFLGTLLVGWLLTNLPSIITMAQELIARIQRLYTIVTGFFDNTIKLFRGFGNLLGAVGKNILTFDFTDSKGRVESALKDLGGTFDDMQSQFDEGFKLLTTSLGEGVVSGEDAAPFGTQYENESMQEQPSGGTVSGGSPDFWTLAAVSALEDGDPQGRADVAQSIYNRASSGVFGTTSIRGIILSGNGKQYEPVGRAVKQFNSIQDREGAIRAVMAANKLSRSQAEKMIDDTVSAITNPTLKKKAAEFVENRTDFLGAGLTPDRESSTKLRRRNASDNIFGNYVGPASYEYGRKTQGQASSTNLQFPTISSPPTPREPISPSSQRGISTTVKDEINVAGPSGGTPRVGLTPGQGYLARGGRHKGIDIGTNYQKGYYVSLKLSGTVDYIGWDKDGYGHFVDIKSGNTIYRFAHLAKVMVKRGQPYNGETIGEIGNTGNSYGEHLHYEVRINGKDVNPRPYLGLLSIGRQLTGLAGQPAQIAAPTPAQITPSGTQQRRQASQQLAQQPAGPSVVIIEEEPPAPQPQVSVGGGGAMMIPIVINPLNSFITKKLLLDLAYT